MTTIFLGKTAVVERGTLGLSVDGVFSVEASELQFRPGYWPEAIVAVSGGLPVSSFPQFIRAGRLNLSSGELLAVTYQSATSAETIHVFND